MRDRITKQVVCPDCGGSGHQNPFDKIRNGNAVMLSTNLSLAELEFIGAATCATCEGDGYVQELATLAELAEELMD